MKEINIAKTILLKRKERKITQDELAAHIGVSKAAISKWETGQSYPDITLLPILASYFDVSIDELIGYKPQLELEQIKDLYKRLCTDFVSKPFEYVILECEELIKTYYSCFPLLHRVGLLFVNHSMLASNPEETARLNKLARTLFRRVKVEGDDVELSKQALYLEAYCCLLLGEAQEALALLKDVNKPNVSSEVLVATAYQMLGQIEEAHSSIQIGIVGHLMEVFQSFPMLLQLNLSDLKRFETIVEKIEVLDELFGMRKMNPYLIIPIQLTIAQCYMQLGDSEKALVYLEQYSRLATNPIYPIKFKGNDFFNLIENWIREYQMESPPRDEFIIKQSLIDGITNNPIFIPLQDDERLINIIERMKFQL